MAKFYGKVGFGIDKEDPVGSGNWFNNIEEKTYFGDVIRNSSSWNQSNGANDNLMVNHRISIIGDQFAYQNCAFIKYVEWMGVKWKVTSIEVEHPRLILTYGGVWNGEQA